MEKYWGLRSVFKGFPFDFWCSTFSGGGSKFAGEFFLTVTFRASCWRFSSVQYYQRSPLLFPGCGYPPARLAAFFSGSSWFSSFVLPAWQGLQSSWRECFAIAGNFVGSLIPAFCFPCLLTDKGSMGSLPLSQTIFLVYPSFLMFCEEERIK